MNLYFGKISKEYDQNQIEEGYYEAPKGSTWFGDLNIGDYVYLIGGDKIQFWQALNWENSDGKERLKFSILNNNLNIALNDLIALNFLKLSKALFVLTSRSSPKAFHKLEMLYYISPEQLAMPSFYQNENLYRTVNIVKQDRIENNSQNIQLHFSENKLTLVNGMFFADEVFSSFRDNLPYLGKGARNKDKTLQMIKDNLEGRLLTRNNLGFRNFYDAFFCDYNGTKHFLVGAFWTDNIPEDMTQTFVLENRWENGYDDQFIKETNAIPKGSLIAIKSAYTRERTRSVMMIKARGRVKENLKDGHNIQVEWEKDFKPFEVNFGGYMTTVKEVIKEDHIDEIWSGSAYLEPINDAYMNTSLVELLKYKKQVILQGPPGTGKTKLAKEIAEELIGQPETKDKDELSDKVIVDTLRDVSSLTTVFGKAEYEVVKIDSEGAFVTLKRSTETEGKTSFSMIKDFYQRKVWENDSIPSNDHRRAAAIAKYLYDNIVSDKEAINTDNQFKFLQFHPSYSYEDFVRGIVAKPTPDGERINYEAENKVLSEFANEALLNYRAWVDYINSDKQVVEDNKSKLNRFITHVIKQIDQNEKFSISENVYIFYVDDKRFKYKGDNWEAHSEGLNMNFSELEKIIEAGISERNQIVNLTSLNALTRSHATYYNRVVELFRKYINSHVLPIPFKRELKNYVLVIDEINRANLSTVLGELIYALEYRGSALDSMYKVGNSNKIILPPNLYIIGTMNTADRSVGHIDYAIRRRFAFVDVLPKDLTSELGDDFKAEVYGKVANLFTSDFISGEFDAKDVQLGHSYFIQQYESDANGNSDKSKPYDFKLRIQYEILPILKEYLKDGVFKSSAKSKIEEIENQYVS